MAMGIPKLFGGNFPLMERALNLRARRQELIVSNIANADTPHYKSFDIVIEDELNKTGSAPPTSLPLETTQPNHLRSVRNGFDQVTIHTRESDGLSLRGDGNTVDMDREMVDLSENAINYRASSQIISKMFGVLKAAINSGK
jgi:flagellar basal-body rod protein FlgB